MKNNEGIIINDSGNLNAEQLAVGKSANITITSSTQNDDVMEKINSLLADLESEKHNIENYEDIKKAGESVKTELEKKDPDKNILTVLLSMIANSVPAISGITKTIKVIKEAIEIVTE